MNHVARVEKAIDTLQKGGMVILVDSELREDEGDLFFAAQFANATNINFMLRHCSGIICLALLQEQIKKLGLNFLVPPHENKSRGGTPFVMSIEAKEGVTTGVSAQDRATTILAAIHPEASADSIVKPGHVFPLCANEEGVLIREGHTEGTVDMMRLAGLQPAAVLCEVMNPDGTMARGKALLDFAAKHDIPLLAIEDIINYRLEREDLILEESTANLPLAPYGAFKITAIKERISGAEHVVLLNEKFKSDQPALVRIHSSCITGDLFGSQRCDCHQQLHYAMTRIADEGGMLIYLNQEGRGIGIFNKIKAYVLQEQGMDTVEANQCLGLPADLRRYHIAANILRRKQLLELRLLTNNPDKIKTLLACGINKVCQETLPTFCNEYNKDYLLAKKNKLQHFMQLTELGIGGLHS